MDQIGTSGKARFTGIPAFTVTWGSGTTYSMEVLQTLNVTPMVEAAESRDNDGEPQVLRRYNKRVQFSITGVPIGAASTNAKSVAEHLPYKNDVLTLGGAGIPANLSQSGTVLCESADCSYTPDGELVVNMTGILYVGKTFAALS